MSLKLMANRVLLREHVDEHSVNAGQKRVHSPVNTCTPLAPTDSPLKPASFPAHVWLLNELSDGKRSVAALVKKWIGEEQDKAAGLIEDLHEARRQLGIVAFVGNDGCFWWQEPWPCPHCGQPSTIEDITSSLDGERMLTLWRCDPCEFVAVTPDAIKVPPMGWVRDTMQ